MPIDEATRRAAASGEHGDDRHPALPSRAAQPVSQRAAASERQHCRFVGEAATLRYIPMREDLDVLEAFRDPSIRSARRSRRRGRGRCWSWIAEGTRAASVGNIL